MYQREISQLTDAIKKVNRDHDDNPVIIHLSEFDNGGF